MNTDSRFSCVFACTERDTAKKRQNTRTFICNLQSLDISRKLRTPLKMRGPRRRGARTQSALGYLTVLLITLLLLRSICGIGNSSQQTSLQCLPTINMVFSDDDKILIKKKFVFEGVHNKEVDRQIV